LLIHIRKTKSEEWKYLAPELKRHGREGKGRRRESIGEAQSPSWA
jgi:hypothetical protein